MKKIIISIWYIFSCLCGSAWHIVGGEIEFITEEPGLYHINLIQYFDVAQEENQYADASVTLSIFSNKDNALVKVVTLPFITSSRVNYTDPQCSRDELQTAKITYSSEVHLDPESFADEEGYYIAWERCCRNETVDNIIDPHNTGMKYMLEIPPLWKDGQPFINSSPELLKPLSDYACINQLFYMDFTGTDRDGDSLVYRLAVPLRSSSTDPLPETQPKPNEFVEFVSGYSLDNMIPGNPALRITNDGQLLVSPDSTGLYVFSVIVEEWRSGEKIGEVQRDFQLLAIDGCEPPVPPEVGVRIPGNDEFDSEVDILQFELEEDKCFDFVVTNIAEGEMINLRAELVGHDADVDELFSVTDTLVGNADTLLVRVCAPGCPPVRDGPFTVDLLASDDACPLPQMDTLRLRMEVEAPPNDFPELDDLLESAYKVNENSMLAMEFFLTDSDGDVMVPELLLEEDMNPAELGLSIDILKNEAGLLEGQIVWNASCQLFDFHQKQHFKLGLRVEDKDVCELENPEITWIDLNVVPAPNTSPKVSIDNEHSVSVRPGETITFDVSAIDPDQDKVDLYMGTTGFSSRDVDAFFQNTTGKGEAHSSFSWTTSCDHLEMNRGEDNFVFYFISDDTDRWRCKERNYDTLSFEVRFDLENSPPEFQFIDDTVLEVNRPFEMEVVAYDKDTWNLLTLSMFDGAAIPSSSLSFESTTGKGTVSSTLKWTPECELLKMGKESVFYDLSFLVYDDACPSLTYDMMELTFELKEMTHRFDRFEPPNVFTPNGDGINDTYTLNNLATPHHNLPLDNCSDAFLSFNVYDRDGKTVFETESRDFNWDGGNVASGTYYYSIEFTKTKYTGFLQIMR